MQLEPEQIVEDESMIQWSIVIPSEHSPFGNDSAKINNRCPFAQNARTYIETVLKDTVSIAITKFDIEDQDKLNEALKFVCSYLTNSQRFPTVKTVEIDGHPEGFQIIVRLGSSYRVDYFWNEFSDYVDELTVRYKQVGKDEIITVLTQFSELH